MPTPERLAAALAALGIAADAPLAVAVSGGADSLALLALAAARPCAPPLALTVDHGLRAESAAEAAHVGALCAAAGIPHRTLVVNLAPGAALQARARDARYALMAAACEAAGVAYLLTAHTRDDQAETVLMRLGRAAGAAGIAGIRPVRALTPAVTLARPALGWPRAHLRAALPTGWAPVDDPSNRDGRFARTAARELLAREPMLDPAALAAAAAHAAEAEAALAWAAERAWASRSVASADGWTLDPHGLPPELQRRLVVRLFAEAGHTPRGPDVQRVMARLHAGMVTTLGPLKLSVGEGRWRATRLGRDG